MCTMLLCAVLCVALQLQLPCSTFQLQYLALQLHCLALPCSTFLQLYCPTVACLAAALPSSTLQLHYLAVALQLHCLAVALQLHCLAVHWSCIALQLPYGALRLVHPLLAPSLLRLHYTSHGPPTSSQPKNSPHMIRKMITLLMMKTMMHPSMIQMITIIMGI